MFEAVASLLASYRIANAVPVLLVPSVALQLQFRRFFADGSCALGVRVETPDLWIADQWQLYGDGRKLVQQNERMLLMYRCCVQVGEERDIFDATAGTITLLANLAREALPTLVSVTARDADKYKLSPAERDVLAVLCRYAALLDEYALCEFSQALGVLAHAIPAPPPLILAGFDDGEYICWDMLHALSERACVVRIDDGCRTPAFHANRASELALLLKRLFKSSSETPLEPTGAVRFLLPTGRYAAPKLILNALFEAVSAERDAAHAHSRAALPVVVAACDPRRLFDEIADALTRAHVSSAVMARRIFANTVFGRAFLALLSFFYDDPCCVSQASDFALSPFSGIRQETAYALDAKWRADRTINRARIIDDLGVSGKMVADIFEALSCNDMDTVLTCFEKELHRHTEFDTAFRAEQLASLSAARAFVDGCARVDVEMASALALLECMSVSATASTMIGAEDEEPEVIFLSLEEAACRQSCSCSTLLLCDLEATSYPVRLAEDAAVILLDKIGIKRCEDALVTMRRTFYRAVSCACHTLILERVLHTEDAEEAYPAVMYEELLDCYSAHAFGKEVNIDSIFGLPVALVPYTGSAGEETLHTNLALSVYPACQKDVAWRISAKGDISEGLRPCIIAPRLFLAENSSEEKFMLSPSAIESYLECPYKWFALRRLRLSELDAGFGPLEMGSFSHKVLKSFFEHFRAAGKTKINEENIEFAHDLLRTVFCRYRDLQGTLNPHQNPLIPQTKLEEAEVDDLEKKLLAYLDREIYVLSDFVPSYFEFSFGDAEPFLYADCLLHGSIDRIDVNAQGQAVVIDYKGSLNDDYMLSSASPAEQAGGAMLPHKVQTLIYAQVVQRVLGLRVVGALYVSYGRVSSGKISIAGCFDRTVLDAHSLPGIKEEACGIPGPESETMGVATFQELLDTVESRIATALRTLVGGCIDPNPRGKNPCGYCPALTCEMRHET